MYNVEKISRFTAFVYSKTLKNPQVLIYSYTNSGWCRTSTVTWSESEAAKRMLTS